MKPVLLSHLLPYVARARDLWRHEEELPPPPVIHEDLGGMTALQLDEEIAAVTTRIDKGIVQPEGLDGLRYRLGRLQAQRKALDRRKT